jgi:two-component system sensor histidine kinase YesM
MKFRFGQDFSYSVNIHDQNNNPFIPKLIVQPIVENAFKYAFTGKPPWEITIHVSTGDESWQISITDNGGKLDEKKCEEILRGFRSANLRTELKNLSIDGLGLKSVYLRLLLIYGDAAVFEINHNEHTTTFILGGPTYNTLEEYKLEHTIL